MENRSGNTKLQNPVSDMLDIKYTTYIYEEYYLPGFDTMQSGRATQHLVPGINVI
jgi:hypothetical protein